VVLNYARVTALAKDARSRITGLTFRDEESGCQHTFRARCVINATGPFCDQLRHLDDPAAATMIAPSQGVHVVLPREFLAGDAAIMVPHTRDGRVLFAVPWHGCAVVGTTDTPISEVSLEPRAQERELDFILETAGRYMAKRPTRADILSVFTGIRPLVKTKTKTDAYTAALSRDHTIQVSPSGLLTIAGGKWTTYRKMAEDAVSRAADLASLPERPCVTKDLRVHGFLNASETPGPLANYGSDAESINRLIREQPDLATPLHEALPICGAQIVWAARNEMARTLDDVLARRTRALFLNARAALSVAPAAARLLADALGRDENWQRRQLAEFNEIAVGFLPRRQPS
jgi:glycerol-3-phosphate dehydrogenase